MSKDTIELNGKRYDVASGQSLHDQQERLRPAQITSAARRSIDGFSAPKPAASQQQPTAKKASQTLRFQPKTAQKPAHASKNAKPLVRHQQQHAQTLIRSAVKRPDIQPKTAIKPQFSTDISARPVSKIVPKHSYYSTDPHKISHANSVARSQKVQHFSDYKSAITVGSTLHDTPQVRLSSASDYRQPVPITRGKTASDIASNQLASHASQHIKANDDQSIFDQVLANAKAHEQKPLKRTKKQAAKAHRRGLGIGASVLVVVLLGLFIAYQNRASINLQLASAKAGFQATTPSFKPSGYALKDVNASPGTINIRYSAPRGNKILIGQKESNWDSQTLEQNYLAMSDEKYQTHHESGKTIFTYGSHQATWVDGGIWYQIQGNATTNSQELVHIASSM